MKKPMKKIKPRRFAEGGNTFSPEQEKFLGGADRTDPYILARMRKAVPDQAPVEDRIPTPVNQIKDEDSFEQVIKNAAVNDDGQVLETANKGKDLATSLRGENILKRMRDADNAPKAKKQAAPTAAPGSIQRGRGGPTADEFNRFFAEQKAKREATYRGDPTLDEYDRFVAAQENESRNASKPFTSFREGGQVKKMASGGSVSSRGDGIAQRGKTRGKMC